MSEIVNAKIVSTMLGREDHGIMTFMLGTEREGGIHQGYGGYTLAGNGMEGNYAGDLIAELLDTVGVCEWEQLKGKHVRLEIPDEYNGTIIAIGNILKNKWLNIKEFSKGYKGA